MTVDQQPQPGHVHVQPVATACKFCNGPIIYERNQCASVWLLVCCGCCSLLCVPERQAECAACGQKQGYTIKNTHGC